MNGVNRSTMLIFLIVGGLIIMHVEGFVLYIVGKMSQDVGMV